MLNLEPVDLFPMVHSLTSLWFARLLVCARTSTTLEDGGEDPRRCFDIGSRWRRATSQGRYTRVYNRSLRGVDFVLTGPFREDSPPCWQEKTMRRNDIQVALLSLPLQRRSNNHPSTKCIFISWNGRMQGCRLQRRNQVWQKLWHVGSRTNFGRCRRRA